MFYSQQHQSSPVQSTDRSLCPPPPCTRVGSAHRQAPRMEALHTACPLDVMVFQDTRTVLWPRQGTPTLSTPPSATASHHRFVHYCNTQMKICKDSKCANMCIYTHAFYLKHKHTHRAIHTRILSYQTRPIVLHAVYEMYHMQG